jgi:hypothetical protein
VTQVAAPFFYRHAAFSVLPIARESMTAVLGAASSSGSIVPLPRNHDGFDCYCDELVERVTAMWA